MHFEFERLDVYQVALDFVVRADRLSSDLPSGRAYMRDQIRRAANSIPANIAEGVGEFAPKDKARFYRIARRSAVECASHLLVCQRLELCSPQPVREALEPLRRIVAMLTVMARKVAVREDGTTRGAGPAPPPRR